MRYLIVLLSLALPTVSSAQKVVNGHILDVMTVEDFELIEDLEECLFSELDFRKGKSDRRKSQILSSNYWIRSCFPY